ncbi:MAG: DNA polymerase III subunit beta [bacterium]
MKIEIQQEDLQKILSVVSGIVPSKTTMPILSCILMDTENNRLKLSATNLDISVSTEIEQVEIKQEGRVAVPANKFVTFTRSLSPGKVTIEEKKGKIIVISGKATLEEPSMNAEEFPALPTFAEKTGLEVSAASIAEMVKETSYSVSRDETRPALMGILWEVRGDGLSMVATDAHRLARSRRKIKWDGPEDRDIIVDTQGLHQFVRLAEGQESVSLHIGENQLSFQIGATELHTRLLEGPFPDYEAVIPKNNDKYIIVDRDIFSQAIRRVSISADRITSQIRLGIESGRMELSAVSADGSRAEDEIPVSFEGEALEIGFNYTYLQDILKNVLSDTIQMSVRDSQSATLIEPANNDSDDGDLLCLLMPLRLTAD